MRVKGMQKGGRRTKKIDIIKINVFLILPRDRKILPVKIQMHPKAIQDLIRKATPSIGKIGEFKTIEVGLAGDKTPQIGLLTGAPMEPEYQVRDDGGNEGPVLHGRGVVFGFHPAEKKACSAPIDLAWLKERVIWKTEITNEGKAND